MKVIVRQLKYCHLGGLVPAEPKEVRRNIQCLCFLSEGDKDSLWTVIHTKNKLSKKSWKTRLAIVGVAEKWG